MRPTATLLTVSGIALAGALALVPISDAEASVSSSCTFNGIALHGSVQEVESFADIKVARTSSFADLNVEFVSSFASECGQWRMVSSFPDFTITYVSSFADITIKEVTSFPGLP